MPSSARASFTSSSLKGLMIASSFFIAGKLACARPFANRKPIAARALVTTRLGRSKYRFYVNNFALMAGILELTNTMRVIPNRGDGPPKVSGTLNLIRRHPRNGRGPSLALGMTEKAARAGKIRGQMLG